MNQDLKESTAKVAAIEEWEGSEAWCDPSNSNAVTEMS